MLHIPVASSSVANQIVQLPVAQGNQIVQLPVGVASSGVANQIIHLPANASNRNTVQSYQVNPAPVTKDEPRWQHDFKV